MLEIESNSGRPLQTFYDNVSVKQIDVNSTTGAFGILPHHVPSIAVLQPGLVKVYESDKTQNYFGEWYMAQDAVFLSQFYHCIFVLQPAVVQSPSMPMAQFRF